MLGVIEDAIVGELEEAKASADALHESDEWTQAWDDVTGRELIPELVRVARKEEIEYLSLIHISEPTRPY